jgi:uncharacterized protein YaiE (UPF0345 family)
MYINGSFVDSGTTSTDLSNWSNTSQDMLIGSRNTTGQYVWNGLMDELAFFDSALSSSDVTAIYNSGSPTDLTNLNPIHWWRMGDDDGSTGTTITDQGSGSTDLALMNGPTFSTNIPEEEEVFSNTYSLSLDGSNDYVSITQNSAINISGDITLSAWVKRTSTTSYNAIFTKRQVGGSMNYTFTINNTNGQIGLGDSGGSWRYNTTTTLSTNTWYHVAVTVSSGTAQFYVNGVAEDSFTGVSITATTHDLIVGATLGYNNFGGNIDEAAIFNSALSSSDITSIYNSGTPADISPLNPVGWWRMGDDDGGTGTTITDKGSGGNDATLTNGPTFSTNIPEEEVFTNTYSLSLDGSDDYLSTSASSYSISGNKSFSVWVKPTSGSYHYLWGYSSNLYALYFDSSSVSIRMWPSGQGGGSGRTYQNMVSPVSLTNGSWYNITITGDGTTLKLYVNGQSAASTYTDNDDWYLETVLRAGASGSSFSGLVDEFAFFNSTLSSSDVSAIYGSGTPSSLSSYSPHLWWRMGDNDGGTGTTVTDQGSGSNDATLTNGPTFSTTIPS